MNGELETVFVCCCLFCGEPQNGKFGLDVYYYSAHRGAMPDMDEYLREKQEEQAETPRLWQRSGVPL